MDYKRLSQDILDNIGGKENIDKYTHCATRLRITLKDPNKINKEAIEDLNGVIGSVYSSGQYQIIIGQNVSKLYSEIDQTMKNAKNLNNERSNSDNDKNKPGKFSKVLDTISGIFTPLLPAITAAAMVKTLLIILELFNAIDKSGDTYKILTFAGDTAFYFTPILVAFSASLKFNINPYLGSLMGMILIHPTFVEMTSKGDSVEMFGFIPVTLANYSSTVIPIILIIWAASYIDKYVDKICPEALKFFLRPLVTFLIMVPLSLIVIGPIGYWFGQGLGLILSNLQTNAFWILPFVFGALSPIFIMTGMHYAVTIPLVLQSIADHGFDILGVGFLVANIAQGGAAIAIGRYAKNKKQKGLIYSSGFTALLGVTEPALYGVNLKYKKPMLAAIIAGGISGLLAGILNVKRMSFAPTGLTTIPIFIDPNRYQNLIFAILCIILSFILSYILTTIFIHKDKDIKNKLEKDKNE